MLQYKDLFVFILFNTANNWLHMIHIIYYNIIYVYINSTNTINEITELVDSNDLIYIYER